MSYNYLSLDQEEISFMQVKNYLKHDQLISVTFAAHQAIVKCRAFLTEKINSSNDSFYGINTGFGYLQNVRIKKDQLQVLQENLLKSHACGMGAEVPLPIVKLMLMLKVKSLSHGHSGVNIEIVKRLMLLHNENVLPIVYTQGSLGASGDLAPLSHLCLPLIGLGDVDFKGERMSGSEALKKLNLEPLALQSKEGLALINGTQFMSAYGLFLLEWSERLLKLANLISAISFDAFDGNNDCFNDHIHALRPHPGQVHVAGELRKYLKHSEIARRAKQQVQDPYSFRCIPQVHGASFDTFHFVLQTFLRESNSVTDNPNIFPDEDLILSGGNFHGQPLALALDYLSIAMSEIASISERRTFQLLSGSRGLPLFLIHEPGINSGLMIPQYTAAGIVSENKQLCTPASADTISSSNNQEDHVSMGANAATKCFRVIENVEKVLAIELLTATQALEFRRPFKSSETIEELVSKFREKVRFNRADCVLHGDMLESVAFLKGVEIKDL